MDHADVSRFVVNAAKKLLHAKRVILFGSRARGDHRATSDFDFAIDWQPAAQTADNWGVFATEVREHAPTLCDIDLVDLNSNLEPEFRNKIFLEGIIFNGK